MSIPLIGSVQLKNRLFLGPMAGVTDRPFRTLCRELGAAVVSNEMVSANAVKYGNKKTFEMAELGEDEHISSLQLFGPDPETMAYAAEKLSWVPFDFLDINMGCPMPKIVNNGEGSALMRDPERAEAIVRACVKACDRPVTVKIRAGWNDREKNAVELAKRLEAAGAAAIAVHGRTREQLYMGTADWSVIREVKEAVRIPVIGNGDVTTPELAKKMLDETGCDFVMIARGARGNPWLFRETAKYLEECGYGSDGLMAAGGADAIAGGEPAKTDCHEAEISMSGTGALNSKPGAKEVRDMMLRHTKMEMEEQEPHMAICRMRKHVGWYTAGFPKSASVRARVNEAKNYEEMKVILDEWAESMTE